MAGKPPDHRSSGHSHGRDCRSNMDEMAPHDRRRKANCRSHIWQGCDNRSDNQAQKTQDEDKQTTWSGVLLILDHGSAEKRWLLAIKIAWPIKCAVLLKIVDKQLVIVHQCWRMRARTTTWWCWRRRLLHPTLHGCRLLVTHIPTRSGKQSCSPGFLQRGKTRADVIIVQLTVVLDLWQSKRRNCRKRRP